MLRLEHRIYPVEKRRSRQVCSLELTAAIQTGILKRERLRAVLPLWVGTIIMLLLS
jgi:hypothetical protein